MHYIICKYIYIYLTKIIKKATENRIRQELERFLSPPRDSMGKDELKPKEFTLYSSLPLILLWFEGTLIYKYVLSSGKIQQTFWE